MPDDYIIRLQRRIDLVRKMKALLYREKYDDDDRRAAVYEFWRTIGGPLTPAERSSRYRDGQRHETVTEPRHEIVTEDLTEASRLDVVVSSSSSSSNGSNEETGQTPTTRPNPDEWGSPEALVLLYNRLIPAGHPRVTRLTPARRDKARKYLRDFPEEKFWTGVFTEIQFSALLRGLVKSEGHRNFRADFDWLLTRGKDATENAVKVQEGKYRDA